MLEQVKLHDQRKGTFSMFNQNLSKNALNP